MGWWHHGSGFGGWEVMLLNGLMILLVWGGFFALVYFAVRAAIGRERKDEAQSTDQALRVIAERYARGEISSEQYEEMKQVLNG